MNMKPFRGAAINRANPLAGNLVGYWVFNEASGDKIYDCSGYGVEGSFTNLDPQTAWVGGAYGTSLRFDSAASDEIVIADPDSLYTNTLLTYAVWFKPDASQVANATLLKKGGHASSTQRVVLNLPTATSLRYRLYIGSGLKDIVISGVVSNTWNCAVMTYDGITLRAYLNGIEAGTYTTAGTVPTSSGVLSIGSHDTLNFFSGDIDQVMIWRRALFAEEVFELCGYPYTMFKSPASGKYNPPAAPSEEVGTPRVWELFRIPLTLQELSVQPVAML